MTCTVFGFTSLQVLISPSYVGKDGLSSPLSPYYNARDVANMKTTQRGSSDDFDDANMWRNSYPSDAEGSLVAVQYQPCRI